MGKCSFSGVRTFRFYFIVSMYKTLLHPGLNIRLNVGKRKLLFEITSFSISHQFFVISEFSKWRNVHLLLARYPKKAERAWQKWIILK